jgi:hypothetical protein
MILRKGIMQQMLALNFGLGASQGKDEAMKQVLKASTPLLSFFFLTAALAVFADGQTRASRNSSASVGPIQKKESYV